MAEVGLVLFARTALEVMQEVLPAYSGKYSKHTFTQPQLMTILCLMRFEDWTFREAEVRLAEHSDLRAALDLKRVPDHTTLYRFMRRVTDELLDEVLAAVATRLMPRAAAGVRVRRPQSPLTPRDWHRGRSARSSSTGAPTAARGSLGGTGASGP